MGSDMQGMWESIREAGRRIEEARKKSILNFPKGIENPLVEDERFLFEWERRPFTEWVKLENGTYVARPTEEEIKFAERVFLVLSYLAKEGMK